jgi:hypothetical protein
MKKWIAIGLTIASAFQLLAQAPEMFRYQGRLADGTNLVNATLPMSFKLYNAQSGGLKLYEDSNSVLVADGLYSTYIGDNTVYGSLTNAMTNAAVYLELTVNGETLSPRERLVSVPYALNAPSIIPTTLNGDPTAVSNVVVSGRWTKNIYANGHITMSDKETGRMWLYNANPCGSINWYASTNYCDSLTYAGYSDWRLPSKYELALQFYSSECFSNVQSSGSPTYYWSSTLFTQMDGYVFAGDMCSGPVSYKSKASDAYVWPVRDGK